MLKDNSTAFASGEFRPYNYDITVDPISDHTESFINYTKKLKPGSLGLTPLPMDYRPFSLEVTKTSPDLDHASGLNCANVVCLKKAYDNLDESTVRTVYHVHIDNAATDHQLRAIAYQATRHIDITVSCSNVKTERKFREHAKIKYDKVNSITVVQETPDNADILLSYLNLNLRHDAQRHLEKLWGSVAEHGSLIAVYADIKAYRCVEKLPGVRIVEATDDHLTIDLDGHVHQDHLVDFSSLTEMGPYDDAPHRDYFGTFPSYGIENNNYVPKDMMASIHRPRNGMFRVFHGIKETTAENEGVPVTNWKSQIPVPDGRKGFHCDSLYPKIHQSFVDRGNPLTLGRYMEHFSLRDLLVGKKMDGTLVSAVTSPHGTEFLHFPTMKCFMNHHMKTTQPGRKVVTQWELCGTVMHMRQVNQVIDKDKLVLMPFMARQRLFGDSWAFSNWIPAPVLSNVNLEKMEGIVVQAKNNSRPQYRNGGSAGYLKFVATEDHRVGNTVLQWDHAKECFVGKRNKVENSPEKIVLIRNQMSVEMFMALSVSSNRHGKNPVRMNAFDAEILRTQLSLDESAGPAQAVPRLELPLAPNKIEKLEAALLEAHCEEIQAAMMKNLGYLDCDLVCISSDDDDGEENDYSSTSLLPENSPPVRVDKPREKAKADQGICRACKFNEIQYDYGRYCSFDCKNQYTCAACLGPLTDTYECINECNRTIS